MADVTCKFVKNNQGQNYPLVERKVLAADSYDLGDGLKVSGTTLIKATQAADVKYVCVCDATLSAATEMPVYPVYDGQIWDMQ